MKLIIIAAFLAIAAAVPSSYKPEYKAPSYSAPSYPAPKYPAPAYPAPAYPAPAYSAPAYSAPAYSVPAYSAPAYSVPAYSAPAYSAPAYNKDNKYADITITSQSDVRNLDGSSQWSYAQSDYTTREESQVQKKMQGVTYDSYGKESYGEVLGNTNKGSSYWVSPEGEKFTLTWTADDAGFQPKGDHLPVAPVHEYELPVAPVHEYELPVAPALPYSRTGPGY
ncbi:endocuticle structural glycoprotein SgAbd-1-like [Daphnia carinata]|uniref:endocuticle structural glycoprotein SgAbd-1-like n=1 Tax=Daphnia carinata TaxID=120202 RepID=UPI0025810CF6|nr:endocuticle structural glycoprotein SgAbd-1-like [Daphnia carinata]